MKSVNSESRRRQATRRRVLSWHQRGAAIAELVVALPALLMLGLGVLESALFYQAKTTVTYATFEAARKGATTHAQKRPMRDEFGMRIASIYGGDGSGAKAQAAMAEGQVDAHNPLITTIDIINPNSEAFLEFGVENPKTGQIEIPNTHLRYRDPNVVGAKSEVNVQDANLLKIQAEYGYQLRVPLVAQAVTGIMKQFDPGNARYYDQGRIPISAVATVRMQSAAWEDGNLLADGTVPGDGDVPNGEVDHTTPPGGDDLGQGGNTNPFTGTNGCDPAFASCISDGSGNSDPFGDTTGANSGAQNQCERPATGSEQTSIVPPIADRAVGNPIDVVSGNKYQLETDLPALPGPLGLVWQRHYNSQTHRRGPMGTAWRHSYEVTARWRSDDSIKLVQADGRVILFSESGDRYRSTLVSDGWLTIEDDVAFDIPQRITWHWPSGQTLQFNQRGDLSDIRLPSGESVSLQYDDGDNLILVKDTQDRQISIGHYPNGRIKSVTNPTGQSVEYSYDRYGNIESAQKDSGIKRNYHYEDKFDHSNLTGITNELGIRYATWQYDEHDRAISSTHADGVEEVRIEYADDGTRLVTNSLGEASTYLTEFRQGVGLVTAIQGNGCSSCSTGDVEHEYDSQLQLLRSQHKDGSATVREYDSFGRTTRLTTVSSDGDEKLVAAYEYGDHQGAAAQLPQRIFKPSVNPDASHTYSLSYNAYGQLTEMLEHGWSPTDSGNFELKKRTTKLAYENGKLSLIDGPRDNVQDLTSLHYDNKGRLKAMDMPDGRSLTIAAYDRLGRPAEIRQGEQQPTRLEYNVRGDVTKVTQRGQSMQYQYDAAGQLVKVLGPDGESLSLSYDAAGRATEVIGPNGRQILTELDSENRVIGNQLLGGQDDVLAQISYLYDAQGRLSQIQRNGETSHTREYDSQGNVVSSSDAAGHQTQFEYSSLGDLLAITQPNSNTTRLAYDAKRNLSGVTDARENHTRYEYNDFGQLVAQHSPDTGTTRFDYDAAGNQTRKRDAQGQVTTYLYDAANRMVSRTDADGMVSYEYDLGSARLAKVQHGSSVETFAYNRDAQLIEHSRRLAGKQFTTEYNYSSQGKLLTKQLPDGQWLNYHYHEDGPRKGTLRAITRDDLIGQTTVIGELNTNDTATLETYTHGNGITVRKEHDGLGTATALSIGQTLQLSYQYDEAGRIVGIAQNDQQNWYQYDRAGQLLGADTSLGRFEYQYDSVGNRTEKTTEREGETSTETYTYAGISEGNALLSVNDQSRTYNPAGNPINTGKHRYEHNAQQRPTKVFDAATDQLIAEYDYNSFGARIKKVTYGGSSRSNKKTVTYYLYDGRKLAAEVNEDGDILAQYLYYKGKIVAKLDGRDIYAVHGDHLGTPQVVTDDDQNTVWAADYTPFGEAEISKEQVTLNLRLPGQYFDEETGGHYNYYRDYEPGTGRYTQSDPIGLLGGINTYAYVANNPLQLFDALGLAASDQSIELRGVEIPVADADYIQRLEWVVLEAAKSVGSDLAETVRQMAQPESLLTMALMVGAITALQAVPVVNAVVDAALIGWAWWEFGSKGVDFIVALIEVGVGIASATTRCGLTAHAQRLGSAVANLGLAALDVISGGATKVNRIATKNNIDAQVVPRTRPNVDLPSGYRLDGDNVIGPRGGEYRYTGKDSGGHRVYENSGNHYTFQDGKKVEARSPHDIDKFVTGLIGERKVTRDLEDKGWKPIGSTEKTDGNVVDAIEGYRGSQGIDGIYKREQPPGSGQYEYIVVETKASTSSGTGSLQTSGDGAQLSDNWIRRRVERQLEDGTLTRSDAESIIDQLDDGSLRTVKADVKNVRRGDEAIGDITYTEVSRQGDEGVSIGEAWNPRD